MTVNRKIVIANQPETGVKKGFLYALKTLISLIQISAVAETAKRGTLVGGLIVSVPIVSVISMVLLYFAIMQKSGSILAATSIRYQRGSSKSRRSQFSVEIPIDIPVGSIVRIKHHESIEMEYDEL